MNEENSKKLNEDFPGLFDDGSGKPFHFGCGDGWYNLIRSLCLTIYESPDMPVLVTQIKEKFGGLRFYYYSETAGERTKGAVDLAERLSTKICDVCGSPGSGKNMSGWYRTLCHDHTKSLCNHPKREPYYEDDILMGRMYWGMKCNTCGDISK